MMIADVTRGVQSWWAPLLAFAAGVVSFASPCVLPLVPGYLSFVTGERAIDRDAPEGTGGVAVRTRVRTQVLPILLFILGFALVFTLLGAFAASALSRWLRSTAGQRAAGVIVLAFGLFMLLYAFRTRITWLYREERPLLSRFSRVKPGPAAAFPLGMAFAVGWTPCIGPVLGAILTLAANQGGAARAATLLFVYSLGLGIPFFLVGMGIGRLMGGLRFLSRYYQWIAGASGTNMAVIGILLISGQWIRLVAPLSPMVSRFTPAI